MNYLDRCEKESDTINKKITASLTLIITLLSTISGCLQQEDTKITIITLFMWEYRCRL